jgi:hypothetical protein
MVSATGFASLSSVVSISVMMVMWLQELFGWLLMERNSARKTVLPFLLFAFPLFAVLPALGATPEFFLSCEADNDLYQVLTRNDIRCSRYQTPTEAIEKAPVGSPVLVLGAGYPAATTPIEPSSLRRVREKKIRHYLGLIALKERRLEDAVKILWGVTPVRVRFPSRAIS